MFSISLWFEHHFSYFPLVEKATNWHILAFFKKSLFQAPVCCCTNSSSLQSSFPQLLFQRTSSNRTLRAKDSCMFEAIANRADIGSLEVPVTQLKSTVILLITSASLSLSILQHWDISQTKIRVISTLLFVLFGCLLFVALPAAIFKHIEGWSALESLYFVVITLTTIGFGDFVAGRDTKPVLEYEHLQVWCLYISSAGLFWIILHSLQWLSLSACVSVSRWFWNRVLRLL